MANDLGEIWKEVEMMGQGTNRMWAVKTREESRTILCSWKRKYTVQAWLGWETRRRTRFGMEMMNSLLVVNTQWSTASG